MKIKKALSLLLLLIYPSLNAQAYWVWSPEAGKFVNADGEAADTAEQQYDFAMKLFKEKNLEQAEERFREVVDKYPNARVAPEALYRLGAIYEEQGDYLKAFKQYKRLVESYPQSDRFSEVIEREYRIGNLFLSGKKAKIAGLEILPSLPRAVEVFQHITKFAPYSDYGDKAQFQLGLAYKKWNHFADAVTAFQAVVDQYPQSDLVSQARYQLAETSFKRSASEFRDQRVLDDAAKQVDRFMTRYPDAETAEQAAKIRQVIDEKNAEKNYRVGLYYEKENYLESAVIYYSDVAERYPQTKWGQKSEEKLKALKDPAKYINEQESRISEEEKNLEAQYQSLQGKDDIEADIVRRKLERIKKHQKSLEKDKTETLERRKQDLARRERELKDKFKNLEVKEKLLEKNQSEDLKRAIERWNASLEAEQEALDQEKQQLLGWRQELGVGDRRFDVGFIPFLGEAPSELEKVRQIEAKKFFKLSEEKKSLLEEKEVLYKQYGEVSTLLGSAGSSVAAPGDDVPQKLKTTYAEMERLEGEIRKKSDVYEKHYGKLSLSNLTGAVRDSFGKSLDIINPFDGKEASVQSQAERQMHLKESIATQQSLVQTLTEAFDAQIALQEQKRLLSTLSGGEKADPMALRKSIKKVEKDIRASYQEIDDRHKHKKQLLKRLDSLLKERETEDSALVRTGRTAAAPATGTFKFFKAFLVGLPHKEVELTETAASLQDAPENAEIKKLEEEIKFESLLIDAKSREILNRQKELEILKARASLEGGYKFRSSFIEVPYLFIGEAIDSAKRVVPKKNREEILISRLDAETKKLEDLKKQLAEAEKAASQTPSAPPKIEKPSPAKDVEAGAPSKDGLKKEIDVLSQKLEMQQALYRQEKALFEGESKAADKKIKPVKKQSEKLQKELKEIQEEIADLIKKESRLEVDETAILEKRIQKIDQTIKKVRSKSLSQDLLTEKERMEARLSQLESRRDFLSKELQRFEMAEPAKGGS